VKTVCAGFRPVPLSATLMVMPLGMSVSVSVPEYAPAVVGANVTVTAQLEPAVNVDPQVFVCVNPVPVMLIETFPVAVADAEFASVIAVLFTDVLMSIPPKL